TPPGSSPPCATCRREKPRTAAARRVPPKKPSRLSTAGPPDRPRFFPLHRGPAAAVPTSARKRSSAVIRYGRREKRNAVALKRATGLLFSPAPNASERNG